MATLVRPFSVQSLRGSLKQRFNFLKLCRKEFNINNHLKALNAIKYIELQMRCIRLDGNPNSSTSCEEPKMKWPANGFISVNNFYAN
jgi:hypothetical protein